MQVRTTRNFIERIQRAYAPESGPLGPFEAITETDFTSTHDFI